MEFPCMKGNTLRGRRTACAADSSMRKLYHSCLSHVGANKRTGREDTRVLPSTAVSSEVGGKPYNTPGKSHMWDSASTPFALSLGKGHRKKTEVAHCDMSQIDLSAKWEADQRSVEKTGVDLPFRGKRPGAR